jgi:hypothetical protein
VAVDESAATRSSLLSVLLRDPAKLGVLHGVDGAPLFALAVSPDERLLAVGSDRGTVTVFDTAAAARWASRIGCATMASSNRCGSRPTAARSPSQARRATRTIGPARGWT